MKMYKVNWAQSKETTKAKKRSGQRNNRRVQPQQPTHAGASTAEGRGKFRGGEGAEPRRPVGSRETSSPAHQPI